MPDRKRFGLQSPRELLAKLDWELAQFDRPVVSDEEISSYRAFNCAVTAWSRCDWVWNAASDETKAAVRAVSPKPDANGSEVLAALFRLESRELAICQQLANGAKHFVLNKHNDPNVASLRMPGVSFFESKDGREHRIVPSVGVFIQDGSKMCSGIGLFSRARDYWYKFFDRFSL